MATGRNIRCNNVSRRLTYYNTINLRRALLQCATSIVLIDIASPRAEGIIDQRGNRLSVPRQHCLL